MSTLPNSPIPAKPIQIPSFAGKACAFCLAPATSVIVTKIFTPACDRHGLKAALLGCRVERLPVESTPCVTA
jgi:hypothetical protein